MELGPNPRYSGGS